MIKRMFGFNDQAVVIEKQEGVDVKKVVTKFNIGVLLARLLCFVVGFFTGNLAQPLDRLLVSKGKPQIDGTNSLPVKQQAVVNAG